MRLVRFGEPGAEKPGALDVDGQVRDLSPLVSDWSGRTLAPAMLRQAARLDLRAFSVVAPDTRLGPPVGNVGKIVCIGLNYADHAAESGVAPPEEPILFLKPNSALTGPFDDVIIPPGAAKLDWEVELGVVIGVKARGVSVAQALDHVAGYCVVNDYSERAWQLEGTGTWDKGKAGDGFAPIGPWLVTSEEIPDPQVLTMSLDVNGRRMQTGGTHTMIFSVADLISYVSRYMTLNPGDILSTGTPPGVGLGRNPPEFLRPGDRVELEISGLGRQAQRLVAAAP